MALVKCPECGTEVSDKAIACVKCGYPISSSTPSDPEISQDELATASIGDSGGDAPSPAQESAEFLLKDGGVLVIQQQLVSDDKRVYRVAEIQSAEKRIWVEEPEKYWVGVVIVIGFLFVVGSVKSFFTGESFYGESVWGSLIILPLGTIMVWAGILEWRKRKIETFYFVILNMSSGESVSFELQDGAQVDRAVVAVGEAMTSQG